MSSKDWTAAGGDLKEGRGMTDAAWVAQHLVFERMARAILNGVNAFNEGWRPAFKGR